jgi:hypothetical protein
MIYQIYKYMSAENILLQLAIRPKNCVKSDQPFLMNMKITQEFFILIIFFCINFLPINLFFRSTTKPLIKSLFIISHDGFRKVFNKYIQYIPLKFSQTTKIFLKLELSLNG